MGELGRAGGGRGRLRTPARGEWCVPAVRRGRRTDDVPGLDHEQRELEQGRQIEKVVRLGHVRRISPREVTLDEGSLPTDPGELYIDCTAAGVRATVPRPLFEDGRINLEYMTVGVIPWSAAMVGYIEATRDDTSEKNRLCPPVVFSGRTAGLLTSPVPA